MAKIEIYQSEKDVTQEARRQGLEGEAKHARRSATFNLTTGTVATAAGLSRYLFDKIGFTAMMRDSKISRYFQEKNPFPKLSAKIDKHWAVASMAVGGALLLIGAAHTARARNAEQELDELNETTSKVMVPDDMGPAGASALERISRGRDVRTVSAAEIKSHAERLTQQEAHNALERA